MVDLCKSEVMLYAYPRARRAFEASQERFKSFGLGRNIGWGMETRRPGRPYYWDGIKRGGSPAHPRLIFQFTLSGRGEYMEGRKKWAVPTGHGFTAVLPSRHAYYLPPDSDEWTFFWFIAQHPFATARLATLHRSERAVQPWPEGSPALEAALALYEAACAGKLREVWTFEELLFAWLFASERELYYRRYPRNERQRLLTETRQIVLERLGRPPSAAELAVAHQLERTTFSRHFKAKTGRSPAAFVTEVRLEEALKMLRTETKLFDIARRTGFADANHFCKVFRRHFHSSPGAYRRQMLKR
jgi:AraC-like DNA-binding protein